MAIKEISVDKFILESVNLNCFFKGLKKLKNTYLFDVKAFLKLMKHLDCD